MMPLLLVFKPMVILVAVRDVMGGAGGSDEVSECCCHFGSQIGYRSQTNKKIKKVEIAAI